ncbi:hypothetical protein OH76DRAFT_468747 [Lentinus brumalis]|uniref:Uncharacterized protein n=1 Tax=Lentinus brumalis TaxID=2498619 RepID=A0A371DCM2_9APHY|nr:hypothetical protein OH76DRAFT_468747 [Polyporus brumalis]
MDAAQHYSVSGLVYHPHPPHPISNAVPPHPPYPQDMSWRPAQHSPSHPHPSVHPNAAHDMQHVMPQDHVPMYAHPPQSYLPRHVHDSLASHASTSAIDPGPDSHVMSFESHQIDSSIGPDRGLPRRRIRMSERVQSHGELPEYATISNPYNVCALFCSDVLFVLPLRTTTLRCPLYLGLPPPGECCRPRRPVEASAATNMSLALRSLFQVDVVGGRNVSVGCVLSA